MSIEREKLHVAMLPFLAFGHMIPYFQLAKRIAERGHRVSFIATPRNISRLPQIPSHLSNCFQFVSLPLPSVEGLPVGAEATTDILPEKKPYLFAAIEGLQPAVADFLQTSRPDWLIHDFNYSWGLQLSRRFGISDACFVVVCAVGACYLVPPNWSMVDDRDPRVTAEEYAIPPPWVPFETNLRYKLFEAKNMFGDPPTEEQRSFGAKIWHTMNGCDYVLIKTSPELEPEWIKLLENLNGTPTIPVGFLSPTLQDGSKGSEDNSWQALREWLDKWDTKSVVYMAHGSEPNLSRNDIRELARGLELSGLPFLWNLLKPKDVDPTEFLPEGFEARVGDRGLVCKNWVPQGKILRHEALGGFATHSGWGSVVEGLSNGVPLIMMPLSVDTPLLARLLSEKRVGVEVPRDELDGSFTGESLAELIKLVVIEEKGRTYRENAEAMRWVFGDEKRQEGYVDHMIDVFIHHKNSQVK